MHFRTTSKDISHDPWPQSFKTTNSDAMNFNIIDKSRRLSPVSPPGCRSSSPLLSPAWWPRWCQSGPVHRNGPSSCSAGSSQLSGASLHFAPLSQASDGWSPWFPCSLRRHPWCCSGTAGHGGLWPRLWPSLTSWGWRSWCNPIFCTLQLNCTHSSHLKGEEMMWGTETWWTIVENRTEVEFHICFTTVFLQHLGTFSWRTRSHLYIFLYKALTTKMGHWALYNILGAFWIIFCVFCKCFFFWAFYVFY